MNVEDAARFMAELRPGLAVPMHYGLFAKTRPINEFVMACRAREQATRVLELGKRFRYEDHRHQDLSLQRLSHQLGVHQSADRRARPVHGVGEATLGTAN